MLEVLNLNKNNCTDCYKCIRTCSVKAITYANNTAEIIHDECILCGSCFVVCPQKAKQIRSDLPRVKSAIESGRRVVCSLAPSFIADFRIESFQVMVDALLSLGFDAVEETAIGAQMVSDEYARIMTNKEQRVLISSCCPTINLLIEKYYPTMLPYLAKVLTPMQAHCKAIKEHDPEAYTVFIGPCISKKGEADGSEYTDVALTYDELRQWFTEENIELPRSRTEVGNGMRARFYPATGGILKATDRIEGYRRVAIDGIDNCRAVFTELESGTMSDVFIEMSACEGSCINGPCIREHQERRLKGALRVDTYAGDRRFDCGTPDDLKTTYRFSGGQHIKFGSEAITDMLYKMGKTSVDKEFNCGSCGYPTCRDKALAILEGKAKIEMCLPFLKEKAENFSDTIINNTPNAIIVMDEDLIVQQINRAAIKMFRLTDASDVLHDHIVRILNPSDYQNIITTALHSTSRSHYLAEYQRYVDETVLYDRQYHIVITILRDVTEQETLRGQDTALRVHTIEIADKVIDKQMRVVQEIASLLGETTAETKIALTKLKDAMGHE
ncbi:MAG: PAS domain-containing protein [Clostridiales bacterium]|nr:PAS domain-containing protein [Clostridiales bacterium]